MIEALTVATLIYAGVLVLALAGSLFAIWRLLSATKRALDDVAKALRAVEHDTAGLHDVLEPWPEVAEKAAAAAGQADRDLRRVREALTPDLGATGTEA